MLVDSYNHSKYETTPLREALKTAFTDDQYLFGGQRYDQTATSGVKVAVTTTLLSMSPVVVANYNRQCDDKCKGKNSHVSSQLTSKYLTIFSEQIV
jgi:hypothetical protein